MTELPRSALEGELSEMLMAPRLARALNAIHRLSKMVCALVLCALLAGCSGQPLGIFEYRSTSGTLRIATTTSLYDSGLLDEILPAFEEEHGVRTEVIAAGTGQAIILGERGDVDVVLVHAPELERQFVEQGYGREHTTLMSNRFILVGPLNDPAGIEHAPDAAEALLRIAATASPFVSRGDDSGTHFKESEIWALAGLEPTTGMDWYLAAGQGMGETLLTANELMAYALTDRATFVTMDADQVSNLRPLFGWPGHHGVGDPVLDNPYSVIAVNPDVHPAVQIDLANKFIDWLTSDATRQAISEYGIAEYGESLFTLVEP